MWGFCFANFSQLDKNSGSLFRNQPAPNYTSAEPILSSEFSAT
jgi:hypothetical protein